MAGGALQRIAVCAFAARELAHVARTWIDEGGAHTAVKLLEPLFDEVQRLDDRAAFAFDVLADAYSVLERPRKKADLMERVSHAPNKGLRSAALQRRVTVLADEGDYEAAWRLFQEAQRHEPDNPFLAPLEITLLLEQGERERAKQRGAFWITRLARDREHDFSELIATLRTLIERPDETYLDFSAHNLPELKDLEQLVRNLPPPECHYRLQVQDGNAGALMRDNELKKIESAWEKQSSVEKPTLVSLISNGEEMWDEPGPWIAWLEKHPLAWQSFAVIDDIVLALNATEGGIGIRNMLYKPILDLEHAHALLRLVLKHSNAEECWLEWTFMENRPALRLMANFIELQKWDKKHEQATRLMEWLILTLNPNDNHGYRDVLCRHYLEQGRAEAALKLCERYPDDMPTLTYSHALALYLSGRRGEAAAALHNASKRFPEIFRMMVTPNPKRPRIVPGWTKVGGKDEAWLYRRDHLALWEKSGALAWARELRAPSRRRGPHAIQTSLPFAAEGTEDDAQ